MSRRRITLGKSGEGHARKFLEKKGYVIVETNYRTRYGEIDLIARDRHTIVFIEVKTRNGKEYGSPLAAITPRKQRNLSKAAQDYLQHHNLFDRNARFDAVALVMVDGEVGEIDHIENAFELSYGF